MGKRRQSREMAMKMLFQIDVGHLKAAEVMTYFLSGQKALDEVVAYAEELTRGVLSELQAIDRLIAENAHHWEMDRIAAVDRSILRLAVYELLRRPEVPRDAVFNEAIELAKKYSTEESGKFVNGVLEHVQLTDTDKTSTHSPASS